MGGNGYVGSYQVERLWRDAKLLEINGTAASAVIEYVRTLRELALEILGNKAKASLLKKKASPREAAEWRRIGKRYPHPHHIPPPPTATYY